MDQSALTHWWSDLLGYLFPNLCEVCDSPLVHGEKHICLNCAIRMPLTGLHKSSFNEIHKRLLSKAPIDRAASYFYYYRHNPYTRLIHAAKYNGRPNIARHLAAQFAASIVSDGFFSGIDIILPVPIHPLKRLKRGYNQTDYIARGIIDIVPHLKIAKNLVVTRPHSTQTRLHAFDRWLNARDIYKVVRPCQLDGLHILLVDDVITTGATLTACCQAIHAAVPTARLSILSLAITHL